ncbi:ATP-dependent helicase HrpB [Paenibacillus aquistagni]|uniref:ATP-dependent helicase HrpB n=1 Tax=Paenibacillus aquistagni TaxID=1852522 RepID=A0A1X7KTT5_9BACL|nr:ATP-dependent helicase HrpB [Paenibacillus aquistagni]
MNDLKKASTHSPKSESALKTDPLDVKIEQCLAALPPIPIDEVCPSLKEELKEQRAAVLVAEPGAGKTTRVPLALLTEPWLNGGRVVMLEPRKLAARTAAHYMASLLGERVGETVGYRVRMDSKVSARTRIEVVTEGVLTRMLQADPSLEGVGLLIFDEYHERSLHADLGLALALEAQAVLREDLRILVMSATLAAKPLAELLHDAPILESKGRAYPVETVYVPASRDLRLESACAKLVMRALHEQEGDLLVFLPGAGEIHRTEAALMQELAQLSAQGLAKVRIRKLYSQLAARDQELAIAPSVPNERKIVLTTAIAETSLTVEGVKVVVDCGYMRVSRYSSRTGMSRLVTERVTKDAADQRRGRAGRLGPGVCYRMWSNEEHTHLKPHRLPEIMDADLLPLQLEIAAWGDPSGESLRWMTPPPEASLLQARQLLQQMGAMNTAGALTAHGKQMAANGLHPRLSHMVLEGISLGWGEIAMEWAALLQERDILQRHAALPGSATAAPSIGGPDIRKRWEIVHAYRRRAAAHKPNGTTTKLGGNMNLEAMLPYVDQATLQRIAEEVKRLERAFPSAQASRASQAGQASQAEHTRSNKNLKLPTSPNLTLEEQSGVLLSLGFPDRIAERRTDGRYLLSSGRGAAFSSSKVQDPIAYAPYLVALELDDQGTEARIHLALPVSPAFLLQYAAKWMEPHLHIAWDTEAEAVRVREQVKLGAIVFRERPVQDPDPDALGRALLAGLRAHPEGLSLLPWSKKAREWQLRLQFLHIHRPDEWPAASDGALLDTMEEWLLPHVYGMKSKQELQKLDLASILESFMTWDERQTLDRLAPSAFVVPSGSRIRIDYTNPEQPVLAARLQEMFGLMETPRIAGGRVPLTIHLLSPAGRPVQVTQDLSSFWSGTYFEVKKDLKGRYPKHYWPDDPSIAIPTRGVRPKGSS